MGGAYSGTYPPAMRVAAVVQAALLVVVALVVLARASVLLPRWRGFARWAIWVVVVISAISLVMNVITPQAGERAIWAPMAVVMLVCSLVVAVAARRAHA